MLVKIKENKNILIILCLIIAIVSVMIILGGGKSEAGLPIILVFLTILFMSGFIIYVIQNEFEGSLVFEDKRKAFISYALFINFMGVSYSIIFFEGVKNFDVVIYLILSLLFLYLSSGEYFKGKKASEKTYDFLYSLSAGFFIGTLKSFIEFCHGEKSYMIKSKQEIWFSYFDIVFLVFSTLLFAGVSIYIVEKNLVIEE